VCPYRAQPRVLEGKDAKKTQNSSQKKNLSEVERGSLGDANARGALVYRECGRWRGGGGMLNVKAQKATK